ncbi:hypothetical protein MTsPCn9_15950 [Croceitalea sp. MTPC9]|uniref:helix-turn-helix transcriptional regulator n=1 Tax=unclassified Croceitalea TaxID=2632280 RepID=UPI002B388C06|nr:hypothetical protein MTsPCn6_08800 [Croceitalea sp. MTPC6]GMN16659.1 hypothetical protein MTsPCn9_15950 [Croceitalea sp. MTPC9]
MKTTIEQQLDRIEQKLSFSKKILTLKELSNYTGFSQSMIYKLTSKRRIPFSKPTGRSLFFDRQRIDEWLLENTTKTDKELEREMDRKLYQGSRRF